MTSEDSSFDRLFQSVHREFTDPTNVPVKGELPLWLSGTLIRNGPGKFEVGESSYNHWFDGLALMHRFTFDNGKVTYQNRFLRSDAYRKAMKYNRIIMTEFGTVGIPDPCKSILERFASHFLPLGITDNNLVNFFKIGDDLYATTESSRPRRINPKDLTSVNKDEMDLLKAFGTSTATAHPHVDEDGYTYNIGTSHSFIGGTKYAIIRFDPETKPESLRQSAKIIGTIPARYMTRPSYFHSFGMTENYFVFFEQTLYMNIMKVAGSAITKTAVCSCLEYEPNEKAIFHVVNKRTGDVLPIKFASEAFFVWHTVNSYEDEGHIVFDICCYPDDEVIRKFYLDYLRHGDQEGKRSFPRPEIRRFVLPLHVDKNTQKGVNLVSSEYSEATAVLQEDGRVFLKYEVISDVGFDMPQINYDRVNGKRYRYAYGITSNNPGELVNMIVKADFHTKKTVRWTETDCYPSEPVFAEAPDAVDEDDGVLMSNVINAKTGLAFLLVLDAKTFTEIARAEMPGDIHCPLTFHGLYLR